MKAALGLRYGTQRSTPPSCPLSVPLASQRSFCSAVVQSSLAWNSSITIKCPSVSSSNFIPLHLARLHSSSSSRPFSSTASASSVPADLELKKDGAKGKGLYARRMFNEGEVVLDAQPLAVVPDLDSAAHTCQACFRLVQPESAVRCPDCAAVYCSEACREHSKAVDGHEILCGEGTTRELNAFCKGRRQNFPRVAAYMLAKSFSGSVDFMQYWGQVNELVGMPVPSDPAKLPRLWHEGFSLVKETLSKKMTAGADAFFDTAFNVRTYARLMGNLRLNSFSVLCPLGVDPASLPPLPPPSSSAPTASTSSRAAEQKPAPAANGEDGAACTSGGPGCSDTSSEGCCSSDDPNAQADESWYGLEGPRGGTALYHVPSFVNHDCDPNLNVVIGPFGKLQLVARRSIVGGEELSITYLDSSMQVNKRRGKLLHGYGFECNCNTCQRQLAEAQKEAARAAREARAKQEANA